MFLKTRNRRWQQPNNFESHALARARTAHVHVADLHSKTSPPSTSKYTNVGKKVHLGCLRRVRTIKKNNCYVTLLLHCWRGQRNFTALAIKFIDGLRDGPLVCLLPRYNRGRFSLKAFTVCKTFLSVKCRAFF